MKKKIKKVTLNGKEVITDWNDVTFLTWPNGSIVKLGNLNDKDAFKGTPQFDWLRELNAPDTRKEEV